jgi:hypothetical protein
MGREQLRIFYFEDRKEEATEFADILRGFLEEPKETVEDVFEAFQVLRESDFEHAVKTVGEQKFDLYIVDLEVKNHGMVGLWIMDEINRRNRLGKPPVIWVLGGYKHLEQRLVREYGIAEFFEKRHSKERLSNCLRIMFGIPHEYGGKKMGEPKNIPVYNHKKHLDCVREDRIICVISRNREYEVRLFYPGMNQYKTEKYARKLCGFSKEFEEVIRGQASGFYQISRGVVIHEIFMEQMYTDKKPYTVTMYQQAGEFTIGDAYLARLRWIVK